MAQKFLKPTWSFVETLNENLSRTAFEALFFLYLSILLTSFSQTTKVKQYCQIKLYYRYKAIRSVVINCKSLLQIINLFNRFNAECLW